jgi:hypothetical protein
VVVLVLYSSLDGEEIGWIFVSAGMYGTGIGFTVPFREYLKKINRMRSPFFEQYFPRKMIFRGTFPADL